MTLYRHSSTAVFATCILFGCSSAPPPPKPPAELPRQAALERFQYQLDDLFRLEYQIERKISEINKKSCFVFITGTLYNQSQRTLSKQSVLDVTVLSQGKLLYRDITNPVEHIAPGGRAALVMVVSPVHQDGCPVYDAPKLALRKVFLNP